MYPLTYATENFIKSLELAQRTAALAGTSFVGSEHFIYAFCACLNVRRTAFYTVKGSFVRNTVNFSP